jgi:hypothetical protein
VSSGAYQSTLKGTTNAFVAKIAPTTGGLVYSTYLGGSANDEGNGIAVDSSGATYITGATSSSNFPVTSGAYQSAYGSGSSGSNAFVTRLAGSGQSLLYSTYLGGSGTDAGYSIAIDSTGNAYIAGSTTSTNFPTSDAFQSSNQASSGIANAFVTGLNASGSGLLFFQLPGRQRCGARTGGKHQLWGLWHRRSAELRSRAGGGRDHELDQLPGHQRSLYSVLPRRRAGRVRGPDRGGWRRPRRHAWRHRE